MAKMLWALGLYSSDNNMIWFVVIKRIEEITGEIIRIGRAR
jgi:hypothetical protein